MLTSHPTGAERSSLVLGVLRPPPSHRVTEDRFTHTVYPLQVETQNTETKQKQTNKQNSKELVLVTAQLAASTINPFTVTTSLENDH